MCLGVDAQAAHPPPSPAPPCSYVLEAGRMPQLAPAPPLLHPRLCHHAIPPFLQELSIDCWGRLSFTPGALPLLSEGGLQSLTLSCGRLGADTLQHLGCLTGMTRLEVTSDSVVVGAADGAGAALRHLTALSGLTQLAHLRVELGLDEGFPRDADPPTAAELLAALPRAPLEEVGRPLLLSTALRLLHGPTSPRCPYAHAHASRPTPAQTPARRCTSCPACRALPRSAARWRGYLSS